MSVATMNLLRLFFSVLMLSTALMALPTASPAESAAVPAVKGAVIRDYARLTFEWPQTVFFTATTQGKQLILRFDRKANPDMGRLLSQLSPYVTHAERKADGRTIILSLNRPYRIRTFVSDNINGVDLLGVDPKARRQIARAKSEGKPHAVKPLTKNINTAKAAPVDPTSAVALSKLKPAAGEASANPSVSNAPATAEAALPPVPVVPPAPVGDSMPVPPAQVQLTLPSDGTLKVNLSAASDSAVIRLPFAQRTALAAFVRNRHLWIVFNQAVPLDLSDFADMPRTVVGKAEQVAAGRATAIRMPVDDGVFVQVTKQEKDGLDWAVLVTSQRQELALATNVMVNTEPPSPAHVFLYALDAAEPVKLRDPQIGDSLVVVPYFSPGHGLAAAREFVQFALPATSQGAVVVKKADEVQVVPLRNGVRISMPGGAVLTPGLPPPPAAKAGSASVAAATLFPHQLWSLVDETDARRFTNSLFRRVVEAPSPQEANEARLRLAQYYLSQGMAPEALAHLDGINRVNPSFYRSSKLSALRGAANFLMGRYVDAARDFNASELNNNKEIDFWRSVLADLLGNNEQAYDYLALNEDYFSKYPPIIRQRLAIVAADRAIAAKEYNTALKIFDSLQKDQQIDTISNYINFLMAKISLETGQVDEALATFDKLAEDYDRPFVRANAELHRILHGLNKAGMSKQDAADRLERLRLSWHGDNLEIQVLTLLSDIYTEQRDFLNAMRIWHNTIQAFPNTAVAIRMNRQMQDTFVQVFNEGGFDALPPLEALALYYEYSSYAPAGQTGDQLVERLADRLVSVDLLSQASALLEHQMKFKLEKERRSRIGARLASIYLLDRQPLKAMAALEESLFGNNPPELRLYRNRLTAEALIATNQLDRALEMIDNDESLDAEKIRQHIYWRKRDWRQVISITEAILKKRTDVSAPVTLDESEMLMQLALAYVFTNDVPQLSYLRDYFGPLMADNPNRAMFDFVTAPDASLTTRNFDQMVERLSATREFIGSYQARLETAGLAATPTTATAAANNNTPTP
ncbi:MAG: hypothetical protein SFW63_06200 [Alphaproteobacteria bacterium]|nr:hypothetical protein [Alphaproteobacteria bacterium]